MRPYSEAVGIQTQGGHKQAIMTPFVYICMVQMTLHMHEDCV